MSTKTAAELLKGLIPLAVLRNRLLLNFFDGYMHVQDQKGSGVAGGSSTSGAYNQRVLNTVVENTIAGASLSSNQITLPAGTYFLEASAPTRSSGTHRIQMYNVTDAAVLYLGDSAESSTTASNCTRSSLGFKFTIAATKVIELRHRVGTSQTTNGLGPALTFGDTEIFSDVKIWRIQ